MGNVTIDQADAIETAAKYNSGNANELHRAANYLASKVIERRNTIPILSNILCEPCETGLKMTGNNLDVMASITIDCQIESPGSFTVDARAFAAALKKCGKQSVSIEYDSDAGKLLIASGRTRLTVQTLPVDDFPVMAEKEKPFSITLSAEYDADLSMMAPFMSNEEARYYINGIAFQSRDIGGRQRIAQIATNGSVMSCFTYPADCSAAAMPDHIVAKGTITALIAAMKLEKGAPLSWEFSADSLQNTVTCGAVRIVSKSIDGTYPDALSVLEKNAVATDGAPILIPELIPTIDASLVTKLEKSAGHTISWELARDEEKGRNMTVISDPARPNWMATATQGEMPKGFTVSNDGAKETARRYMAELAASRGLAKLPMHHLEFNGEMITGATFGHAEWKEGYNETFKCWETLSEKTVFIQPKQIWQDGSYSVVMPREHAKLETDVSIDVDGERYPVATNSAGKIHLSKEAIAKICADDPAPEALTFETVKVQDCDGGRHYVPKALWDNPHVMGFRSTYSDGTRLNAKGKPLSKAIDKPFLRSHLSLVAEYDAVTEDTPSEAIAGQTDIAQPKKPMFASVAEFKRAATVGTVWARSNYENGQWQDQSPMLRTVAKVQSEDIVCGIAENTKCGEEYLGQIASREKSGQWLGFPKKGRWESDSKGMIWLDTSGRKMFRFEPVQPESLTERESDAPAMVEAAPVVIDAPAQPETGIEPVAADAFTLSGTIGVTMSRGGSWDWSKGYQGNEYTPSEAIAHDDRPRRLRIVKRYLAMRQERAEAARVHASALAEVSTLRTHAIKGSAKKAMLQEKRRRAVERALTYRTDSRNLRNRLETSNQKHKAMHEKYANAESRAGTFGRTAQRAKDELAKLKALRADPSNPERSSDIGKLKDERDQARGKLETLTAERDRLKKTIEVNAGTLDEMIDRAFRAEAELRDAKAPSGYQMAAPVIAYRQAA